MNNMLNMVGLFVCLSPTDDEINFAFAVIGLPQSHGRVVTLAITSHAVEKSG